MNEHTEICICSHPTNRHGDLGVFNGWGLGHCELCDCKKFECPQCIKENYKNERT